MGEIILGLDLGTTSIGWALLKEEDNNRTILGMGSRILPLSVDDKSEFSSGNKISKNEKRTTKRTQRKGYDRYQLRRKALTKKLVEVDIFPGEELLKLKPEELWGLRSKAVKERVELKEFGRILYHLNQKRGYKSSRSDANLDKKDTQYVSEVKNRHDQIKEEGITIGEKFYNELKKDPYYRIKQQVFPREAYIEEFNAICKQQQKHYPQIITPKLIETLHKNIIYYQRKLKSQKNLVSICEMAGFWAKNKEGKKIFTGPKVAPKSSPLFQVCKIWESINTISLKNKKGEVYNISLDKKIELFDYLDNNETLSSAKLFDILGFKKNEGWYANKQIERGIQGNITKVQLQRLLSNEKHLLDFNLTIEETDEKVFLVDKKDGEVKAESRFRVIKNDFEHQNLYKLWHIIYSIPDIQECANTLVEKFAIEREAATKLANLDFSRFGFGNKSAKAMRKILPFLMEGYMYSDASSFAGYNHSNSYTREEKLQKYILESIPLLDKNSLRQPVVEKILNQMINLVNEIIKKHGPIDEIRVELARELKQSKDERNETFSALKKRERENEVIRKRIIEEYGLRATRNNIIKWRLFHEINGEESKMNASCIYCGKGFGIADTLSGNNIDVEHIIPKSLLFDDSQSNKTLSHRTCNELKDNKTAYDFMKSKGEDEFSLYLERVDYLFKNKIIGKGKRDKLLMPVEKIPVDFIDRQLRQTQYISRKAKEILEQVCLNVWSTSGNVTEYLRRIWGWDDILINLQLPKYREASLTEWKEWETRDGQKHKQEVIKDWSKRDDHRHHAVDALVVACTQQSFIQRLNNLSSQGNRNEMYAQVESVKGDNSLLDTYLISYKPFSTAEVEEHVSQILVSFKAGKKVSTLGSRKVKRDGKWNTVQTGIIIPRGSLSEESVYGKIKTIDKDFKTGLVKKHSLKYLFENSDLIYKKYIKDIVKSRLKEYGNDIKKSIQSLKNDPVFLDTNKTILLEYATCYKEEYVIKYPLENIKSKDLIYVVDDGVRAVIKKRLEEYNDKEKEAFKEPLYLNESKKIPIKTVRMYTGLSSVEPLKIDENGKTLGFVKPGNNHHIAFYTDKNGNKVEHGCTFWHAVERKKHGMPVIIKDVKEVWDKVLLDKESYPQSFLDKLPLDGCVYIESLQQNEMFILGLDGSLVQEAIKNNDKNTLNQYLYRVQKMSIKGNGQLDISFRHHLETQINDSADAKNTKRFFNVQSIGAFDRLHPVKVKVNNLGEII